MLNDWDQDLAFDKFKKFQAVLKAADGTNEATTRLRAIDTILFDVLGWDKQQIETERYVRDVGYADYALFQQSTLCSIIEAKREGATFLVPNLRVPDRAIGFGYLAAQCPEAASAMRQATGYAASEGARYVAITNGFQWLLSLAYVVNQPIESRSVLCFLGLEDIQKRFSLFWDCFSPSGIYSNRVSTVLLETRKASAPDKLSRSIPNYPVAADRNTISDEIGVVTGIVWDNLNADDASFEFLQRCYVRPESRIDSLNEARELLVRRKQQDVTVIESGTIPDDLPALVASHRPDKPIVVLGRIGHGKSTFLKYLRLIEAQQILGDYLQIDIDFLDRPSKKSDVENYVFHTIEEQLLSRYSIDIGDDSTVRGALDSEIRRFRKTPDAKAYESNPEKLKEAELHFINRSLGDRHQYLARLVYHLKHGRKKSIAVFFDNLDRRDDLQEDAFLLASAIARDWTCPVFVCLRPGTFWRSKKEGVLDTIAPRIISISSPKVGPLLKKRLELAVQMAKGQIHFGNNIDQSSRKVSVYLPRVSSLLECAADSFFKSSELRDLVLAFSNGNVRELLRLVRQVLTSKHLDAQKILEKWDQGSYRIAPHEALRALLYGDFVHFDPNSSLVANLFDILHSDPMEHFTRILALRYLNNIPEDTPHFGYTTAQNVMQYLAQIGYTVEHINSTMDFLIRKECCEAEVVGQQWSDNPERLRLSPLGRYHVQGLIVSFNYYDAVVIDTPILDQTLRSKIIDCFPIERRLERSRFFVKYLTQCVDTLQDADGRTFLLDCMDKVIRELDAVTSEIKNAEQNVGPKRRSSRR
jgi:hypothetical protein